MGINIKDIIKGNGMLWCIVLITVITFFPTFFNDFQSGWDDQWMVTNHYTSNGLSMKNIKNILTLKYGGQYAPINQLLYSSLYSFIKYEPFYYHFFSFLLHVINSIFLFFNLKKIYSWYYTDLDNKKIVLFASICTFCFSTNPLQVESVAWVSASKVVLYTFFYLGSTWNYIIFIEKKNIIRLLASIFLLILALGSKEQAISFSLWILLLHWLHGDFKNKSNVLLGCIPILLISLIFGYLYLLNATTLNGNLLNITKGYSFFERINIAGYALGVYIRRWFFPFDLKHIYYLPNPIPEWFLICTTSIVILVILIWNNSSRIIRFWILFFFIHIGLMLHIVPMGRFVITADRYMYLPNIALANILFHIILYKHKMKITRPIFRSLLILFTIWNFISFERCFDWKSTETIRKNSNHYFLILKDL